MYEKPAFISTLYIRPLTIQPLRYTETSGTPESVRRQNIPEEQTSQLHQCESRKSRNSSIFSDLCERTICISKYQPTLYDEILTSIFILFSFLINIPVKAVKDSSSLPKFYNPTFFFLYRSCFLHYLPDFQLLIQTLISDCIAN